ncbi:MAG: glycosyltransferase [Steroidobacteraceae bacterium]
MILCSIAAVPLLIWTYLLLGRGGFWQIGRHFSPNLAHENAPGSVVAIIPARNEAALIGAAVSSLLQQDFAGSLRVIVVDDGSTDGTASAAEQAAASLGAAARLKVVGAGKPEPGWNGKVWAMSQGAAAAMTLEPDYLLFTDADIAHEPKNLAALVTTALGGDYDLVSYMVMLCANSLPEKWLIPAFVYFFLMLYPPAWIRSPRSSVAGAAGGCMLVRAQTLARIGGLQLIRSQLIDDCALAQSIKAAGGTVWLGLTRTARSIRPYGSFAEIGRMISRTAFNQLRHSWLLLAATMLALCVTFALPPLLLCSGQPIPMALGAAAWMLMSISYAPMVRFYGLSALWCVGLPVIAMFYAVATIHSAVQYQLGRGGRWKGRIQDGMLARK